MRVSGNGRRPVNSSQDRKVSSSSLEEKINRGRSNINKSVLESEESIDLNENTVIPEIEKEVAQEEINNLEIENPVVNTEGQKSEKGKKKSRKRKEKRPKKDSSSGQVVSRLGGKRIALMVLSGLTSSVLLGGLVYGTYYNMVRYPPQERENIKESGLGGINRWVDALNSFSNDIIKGEIGGDSYLAKELDYANGDSIKEDFFKKIISTVSYEPKQVEAKNIYGNPLLSRVDGSVVSTDSLVNGVSEEVMLHYIDYNSVPLDEEKIRNLVKEDNIVLGLGDYPNQLVSIFCKYILSLEDIPLVSVNHVPNLVREGEIYKMSSEEDVLLDKALFSSNEFYDLLFRFSEVASRGSENPDWVSWNRMTEEERKDIPEPPKVLDSLPPSGAWQEWNAKSVEEKALLEEPVKYEDSKVMNNKWCGSYYLLNEHKDKDISGNLVSKPIEAEVGNGSIENPASVGTGVVTSMLVTDANGSRVAKPIKVRLIDYKLSQDALNYFESKDIRNRGTDVKSEVQYISYSFEVTNLSNEPLTIYDNSSLSDELANLAPRTGTVYGLQGSVTLQPYETGYIESWGSSTELNKKYLIWGGDFRRELPVAWFRVLAGDIDNPDETKGVTINKVVEGSPSSEEVDVVDENTDVEEE